MSEYADHHERMEQIAEEEDHAWRLAYDDIEDMLLDGEVEAADGCVIEPDGRCPHGYRSPLLVRGLI